MKTSARVTPLAPLLLLPLLAALLTALGRPVDAFVCASDFPIHLSHRLPIDDQKAVVEAGHPMVLNCTITDGYTGTYNSSSLKFYKHDDYEVGHKYFHVIDNVTAQLFVPHVDDIWEGSIFCALPDAINPLCSVSSVFINVAERPLEPNSTSCMVTNWEIMHCSWVPSQKEQEDYTKIIPVDQTVLWAVETEKPMWSNQHVTESSMTWFASPGGAPQFTAGAVYTIVVRVANVLSCKSGDPNHCHYSQYRKEGVDTNLIVKPNAPEGLFWTSIRPFKVALSWQAPSPHTTKNLTYKLCLKSAFEGVCYNKTTDRERVDAHITVNPYTNYSVSLVTIPEVGGFWSDPVRTTFTTNSTEPQVSPETLPSAYKRSCDGTLNCSVTLYWKSVERQKFFGPDFHYVIKSRMSLGRYARSNFSWETVAIVNDSAAFSAEIVLKSAEFQEFEVVAANAEGESPKQGNRISVLAPSHEPARFVVEGDGLMVLLHLEPGLVTADPTAAQQPAFTAFWCLGRKTTCSGEIFWKALLSRDGSGQPSHVLDLASGGVVGRDYTEYMIGLAVSSPNGSFGIQWSTRFYARNGSVNAPSNIRVVQGSEDLTLYASWQEPSRLQSDGYVDHYQVAFCIHDYKKHDDCADEVRNISVPSRQLEYVITKLEANREYLVRMRSVGTSGQVSPWSDDEYATPINTALSVGAITGIVIGMCVIGAAFLLGIVVATKRCRRATRYFEPGGIQIQTPGLECQGLQSPVESISSDAPILQGIHFRRQTSLGSELSVDSGTYSVTPSLDDPDEPYHSQLYALNGRGYVKNGTLIAHTALTSIHEESDPDDVFGPDGHETHRWPQDNCPKGDGSIGHSSGTLKGSSPPRQLHGDKGSDSSQDGGGGGQHMVESYTLPLPSPLDDHEDSEDSDDSVFTVSKERGGAAHQPGAHFHPDYTRPEDSGSSRDSPFQDDFEDTGPISRYSVVEFSPPGVNPAVYNGDEEEDEGHDVGKKDGGGWTPPMDASAGRSFATRDNMGFGMVTVNPPPSGPAPIAALDLTDKSGLRGLHLDPAQLAKGAGSTPPGQQDPGDPPRKAHFGAHPAAAETTCLPPGMTAPERASVAASEGPNQCFNQNAANARKERAQGASNGAQAAKEGHEYVNDRFKTAPKAASGVAAPNAPPSSTVPGSFKASRPYENGEVHSSSDAGCDGASQPPYVSNGALPDPTSDSGATRTQPSVPSVAHCYSLQAAAEDNNNNKDAAGETVTRGGSDTCINYTPDGRSQAGNDRRSENSLLSPSPQKETTGMGDGYVANDGSFAPETVKAPPLTNGGYVANDGSFEPKTVKARPLTNGGYVANDGSFAPETVKAPPLTNGGYVANDGSFEPKTVKARPLTNGGYVANDGSFAPETVKAPPLTNGGDVANDGSFGPTTVKATPLTNGGYVANDGSFDPQKQRDDDGSSFGSEAGPSPPICGYVANDGSFNPDASRNTPSAVGYVANDGSFEPPVGQGQNAHSSRDAASGRRSDVTPSNGYLAHNGSNVPVGAASTSNGYVPNDLDCSGLGLGLGQGRLSSPSDSGGYTSHDALVSQPCR